MQTSPAIRVPGSTRSRNRLRFASGFLAVSLLLALMLGGLAGPAAAISNGAFADGLTGWSTAGAVSVADGVLLLEDTGPASSGAWQASAAQAARMILEFDVLGALSSFTPADPYGFPDIFSASIYLVDDPLGFDPTSGLVTSAVSVLSIDSGGPYDVAAVIGPSEKGGDWLHVTFEFDSPKAWVVPTFELFELALSGGDSQVRIDDVRLTPIPEPASGLLMLLGLTGLAMGREPGRRR